MIRFTYVSLWILLIPLVLYWWSHPLRNRWCQALRLILYVVLVAMLTAPLVVWKDRSGVVIALVDQSKSMPPDIRETIVATLKKIDANRPTDSRLGIVSFAGDAVVEKMADSSDFNDFRAYLENTDATNLSQAVKLALEQVPDDTPARFLVFSDGAWNGVNPAQAFAQAAAKSIPVDFHQLQRNLLNDLAIRDVQAPFTAHPGETFALSCLIDAPANMQATFACRRNDSAWQTQTVALKRGLNQLTRWDSADSPGILDYQFKITAEDNAMDELPEDNLARHLVQIQGRPPILLLTQSPTPHLAQALRKADFPIVAQAPSPTLMTAESLAGYSGVILENVPASSLGMNGMGLLAELVKTGALGLMMTGGRSSFAVGGYYRSPLEEVLPVSMEQRQEIRKSRVSVVVALDRSGSMSMQIGTRTKMDLANLGTLEVFNLLALEDEIGVIAVDSEAHNVLPLMPKSKHTDGKERIRGIVSQGGGIYTYTALYAGLKQLVRSSAATRHMILFADASDAEEPGEYINLLAHARLSDITVSVIALGSETDCDARFLKNVARLGGGICYFADNANELPRIFVEDTFAMVRSTFIDIQTPTAFTSAMKTLSTTSVTQKPADISGYNLCYAKPNTETYFITQDEHHAPLATTGHVQLGRVAAYTPEADGKYTGAFGATPAAPALLSLLANWICPSNQEKQDFLVTQSLNNGLHTIRIDLDPERASDPFKAPPLLNTVSWHDGQVGNTTPSMRFSWDGADTLTAEQPLSGSTIYLDTITIDNSTTIPLAPVSLPSSPEYQKPPEGAMQLVNLSGMTGGHERLQPETIWAELPHKSRYFSLVPLLALLSMLLLLCEVAERRLNLLDSRSFKLPQFRWHTSPKTTRIKKTVQPAQPVPSFPEPAAVQPSQPSVQPSQPSVQPSQPSAPQLSPLSEALKKAKRNL